MAKLSPLYVDAQFINAIPANGAKVFTYAAGSTTKQATYTDATGITPQSNPIILNARGEPANPIWLTEGLSYKFVFAPSTDSDPPVSPIRTIDNVTGVNDASITIDQWVASGLTPTFISSTSFTLAGDQTSAFQVGRRLKLTETAGTVYGTIASSAYTTVTTVTVTMDGAQVLDSGLSVVSYGILTNINDSIPSIVKAPFLDTNPLLKGSGDATKLVRFEVDGLTTATTRVIIVPDKDLILNNSILLSSTSSVAANALTLTFNGGALDFRSPTATIGIPITLNVAANSIVVPSGATLGTVNTIQARLILLAAYNAGTPVACVVNLAGGVQLDETNLISPTTISAGATANNVIYSASAVSAGSPYRVVGYVDITEAVAGTWATPAINVQGYGGQALAAMSSIGYGQTWQNVTGSRVFGTVYYNTTSKPIQVIVSGTGSGGFIQATMTFSVNGVLVSTQGANSGTAGGTSSAMVTAVVPPNSSYQAGNAGGATIITWFELR